MKKSYLKNYAKLIVRQGVNIQKGQNVVIVADLDQPEFISYLVEECYKCHARSVEVKWNYQPLTKLHYRYKSIEALTEVPKYVLEREEYYVKTNPAMIYILSADPDGLQGINHKKLAEVNQKLYPIMKPYRDARENKYQWCIAGVPSYGWAKKVFPHLTKKKAYESLWEAILKTSRALNDNPMKAWEEHNRNLKQKMDYLNSLQLASLHYQNSLGTDFTVGLLDGVKWEAGSEIALGTNIVYNPNIPSEECFTSPNKNEMNGVVYSSKPLSYQNQLIEDFYLVFKDGKVVEVHAKKNEELLKQMISMDEGASRLGEVALVPFDSPINQSGILFYNTLYDENASCHLALGVGFTNLVDNYENYKLEELYDKGINNSMIHVDFMIGTKDLSIVGKTKNGKEITIFKDGNWAF